MVCPNVERAEEEMKLGFFTDTHARYDSPVGRSDEFRLSLYKKLEQLGEIWDTEKVEYVLFGGDLFHTPDPSNSVIYDVMSILKSWNLPIIGVVGSHDYFGYQMKSLKRTALGLVVKSGLMELVDDKKSYFISCNSKSSSRSIDIYGTPHTYWLCDDAENFSMKKSSEELFQIQLVHGDLLDKQVPWQHVLVKDIKTESDLVLSGHYHPGWKNPIKLGNTTFINPGSIARLENTGVARIPRTCIIEVEERAWSTRFVDLKVNPYPFKEKVSEQEVEQVQDINKLLQLIEETQVESVDIKNQIPLVAKELKLSEDRVEKAFELLELV